MTERERQAFIRGLSFEGEIEDRDGVLGFTVKKDVDLAAVFKGVYDPAADPPIQRINLGYCIADQMVWYSMELDFGRRDDGWDSVPRMFQLSDGEREYLKNEMDCYCLRQTGMPLLEYSLLHWSEDNGPTPTLAELGARARMEQPMPQPISAIDFMGWFASQCVDQMAEDMRSKATPEEWERLMSEVQQDKEQQDKAPGFTGPSM